MRKPSGVAAPSLSPLARAAPSAWARKETTEKKERKEEKLLLNTQTNQKQLTTKPCPPDSFTFTAMDRSDMVKHKKTTFGEAQFLYATFF